MLIEFWIPAVGLLAAVAAVLLRALYAPADSSAGDDADQRVYKDQLDEVARDIAKGSVSADEGARLRTEVARRLIEADRAQKSQNSVPAKLGILPVALTLALLGAGAGTYYFYLGVPDYPDLPLAERLARSAEFYAARPSQEQAEAAIGPQGTEPADTADADLLRQLRAAVAARPDDLQGHQLLAKSEAAIGNLAGARAAFQRVVALLGEQASAGDHASLAELMIAAAGGQVTPEAEAQLVAALNGDPKNGVARYYSGLLLAQVGRPDQAFAMWKPLLDQSGPTDAWYTPIRAQIENLAAAAGVNYRLPDEKAPDEAAVAAAGDMNAQERLDMIQSMVGCLEARLMSEGGTAEEWVKLVTSFGVLGDKARFDAALGAGRKALAADAQGLATLNAAAEVAP